MSRSLTMLARVFVLKHPWQGLPKVSDFEIVEETLSDQLNDGEILAKADFLTVDPYMRLRSVPGQPLPGGQVARVLKSRSPEFPEGSQVYGFFGWRDLTIYKPDPNGPRSYNTIHKMPEMKGLSDSYALGAVGMPGNTAYFGLTEICKPKAGETLVVTAAAGAVGSVVGQIGKIKGCRVIGFAGSDDKVKWLEQDLGFDVAINYKKVEDLDAVFKQHAPNGIDCYFDNVAGDFNYHVVRNMNPGGRIAQCGSISTYNADRSKIPMVPFDYPTFRVRKVIMEGFQCVDTLAPSHVDNSSEEAGSAANTAAKNKINKYKTLPPNYVFIPFAVETMGPFGLDAKHLVNVLGTYLILITGDTRAKSYLTQRISLCIQRGNAASIMGTIPPTMNYCFRQGFQVNQWNDRWFEGLDQIRDWILEGKLKVRESITEGFENMPQAFIDMLQGKNTGKQIIKV